MAEKLHVREGLDYYNQPEQTFPRNSHTSKYETCCNKGKKTTCIYRKASKASKRVRRRKGQLTLGVGLIQGIGQSIVQKKKIRGAKSAFDIPNPEKKETIHSSRRPSEGTGPMEGQSDYTQYRKNKKQSDLKYDMKKRGSLLNGNIRSTSSRQGLFNKGFWGEGKRSCQDEDLLTIS